jgi:hypothetical protein
LKSPGCGIFSEPQKEEKEVQTRVATSNNKPLPVQPTGAKHVDDERRAVLRPVALQGPCFYIEACGAQSFKTIL